MAHDRRFAGFGKLGGAQTGHRVLVGLVVQEILLAGTGNGGVIDAIGRTVQTGFGMFGHDEGPGLLQEGSVMHKGGNEGKIKVFAFFPQCPDVDGRAEIDIRILLPDLSL